MDCRTIRTLTAERDYQDLPPAARAHLEGCPACRDELEDPQELPAALVAPSFALPPPDLTQRILATLPTEKPTIAAQQQRRQRTRRRVLIGLSIAFLVLVLQIGILGIFVDSRIPAGMVGGVGHSLGRLVLALTIAIKPVVGILSDISMPIFFASAIAVVSLGWLWLRLIEPPAPLLFEVRP